MAQGRAKIEAEWDEELEGAPKKKSGKWEKYYYINRYSGTNNGGAIYGLGFIGAVVYFISTATTFWVGVLGVLKAIVWPAFMVYELLKFLGA